MAGNLAEQGRSSPDIAYLQERGGLTPMHWEEVIRRIGEPREPIRTKLVAYGQKVIDGEFPDSGNHHRDFLGKRHWDMVYGINTTDHVLTPRRLWFAKRAYVPNPAAQEASKYALTENRIYTFDDYIDPYNEHGINANVTLASDHWLSINIRWSLEHQKWEIEKYRKEDNPSNPPGEWNCGPETVIASRIPLAEEDLINARSLLLKTWLLTESEVIDPLHTSPAILKERLREITVLKPDEIRERLNARMPSYPYHPLRNSPHFGMLEREIA